MTGLNPILQTECNIYISINGISSDLLKVNFGVPQGAVLSLLLFLVYINDLHDSIRFSFPFHFADDTGLLNIQAACVPSKEL